MKKILGLDLGVSSIGWALIQEDSDSGKSEILGMGVRIVPLTTDEKDEFAKGNKISKNQDRTLSRSLRRGLDRYQQRRAKLKRILEREGMVPTPELFKLPPVELYKLRAKAAEEKVSPSELGRILLHLNQRRGYLGTRLDEAPDSGKNTTSEEKGYVAEVNNRHKTIQERNQTVGQYFHEQLSQDPGYLVKNQVFPRKAYLEEFDAIMARQHLPKNLVHEIRDKTIYFQRPLKSKKNLVKVCEFAGKASLTDNGIEKWLGPKVSPTSSPIAQVSKLWENINNLKISYRDNTPLVLSLEQKKVLFDLFDQKEVVKLKDIAKSLGYKDTDLMSNKQLEKGIRGNTTRVEIARILQDNYPGLLRFNLNEIEKPLTPRYIVHKKTGEILYESPALEIDPGFEKEPLYQLWHVIYAIPDLQECQSALEKRFGLDSETAARLARLDFTKSGFTNKSAKAIRRILPYLMKGFVFSDACELAGYNHSDSVTTEENASRALLDQLPLLPKNTLRQPVVEKILNQLIHVVNAVHKEYGRPDETRIELARELRQSQEERNKAFSSINKREKENDAIRKKLQEFNVRATRNNVIKDRLFTEISGEMGRVNATCIYCGKMFGYIDAMRGNGVDVEHIIPQQLRFDDSQANKTLAHRHCNLEKDNKTAYDYMASKSQAEFDAYIERVQEFYEKKIISGTKRKNLLTPASELKDADFINRQLQETRYISKKSKAILARSCREITVTTGKITEYLRRLWGWGDVLMHLHLPNYRENNLTITEQRVGSDGHTFYKEVIPEWSKRNDHRHHAIDALVVACTKQGFIQRLNTLHAKETRDFLYQQTRDMNPLPGRILEQYLVKHAPFSTREVEAAVSKILVSLKPGKKVATRTLFKNDAKMRGKNRITGVLTPRGPLSNQFIYGKVKSIEKTNSIKYLFENPDTIIKDYIKAKVKERLSQFEGDVKEAIKSLKKKPIYLDLENSTELTFASYYKENYVYRYPLTEINLKNVDSIIDPVIREKIRERLLQFPDDEKKAMQGLDQNPIWFNEKKRIPIKSVRCFTGLSAVEPINRGNQDEPTAFVRPDNNHHLAFYTDPDGNLQPHIATFWHAVERKKYGLSPIIKNPAEVWDNLLQKERSIPEAFQSKLPADQWKFEFSMEQNEMFTLGLKREDLEEYIAQGRYDVISKCLYRVQKMAIIKNSINLWFRHHLETALDDTTNAKSLKKYYNIRSIGKLLEATPLKVRINYLGQIELI